MAFVASLSTLILEAESSETLIDSPAQSKNPLWPLLFPGGASSMQATVLVFLLSFGFFLLVTNYASLSSSEPAYQVKLSQEIKTDLQALGPFKLSQVNPNSAILSRE